jgi:hypothetical protein
LRLGTLLLRWILKCRRNILWVKTESLFLKYVSTAKARCSTDLRSMATEMLWVPLEGRSRTNYPCQRFHSQLFCKIVRFSAGLCIRPSVSRALQSYFEIYSLPLILSMFCGIFRKYPDGRWGPLNLLYKGNRVSFMWVKQSGRGVDLPLPTSAEVEEREELYLCAFVISFRVNFTLLPPLCAPHSAVYVFP